MMSDADKPVLRIKIQVLLDDAIAIGPGKAELLTAIDQTGSIAAAGRMLGFSYRRTRDMVDTLNACWCEPLVSAVKGGPRGGGAALTDAGREVSKQYGALEKAVQHAAYDHGEALLKLTGSRHDAD